MLTIPIETLAYIVTKAREFDAEVPPVNEDSGSNPSDDADRDVLEASADNPTRQELADAIDGLGDPERIELLALVWLGRGDYAKEEWREALEEARRIHDNPSQSRAERQGHQLRCRNKRACNVSFGNRRSCHHERSHMGPAHTNPAADQYLRDRNC